MKAKSRVPSSAPKVALFAVVSVVLIALLGSLIGNVSLASRTKFHGLFTDATGVFPGDRVRLAGVEVGRVDSLDMFERGSRRLARVSFSVDEGVPVFRNSRLELRYENIVGQRYLAIVSDDAPAAVMPKEGTFDESRTTPALSLTELFNGFQPLFEALDPGQINRFTFELVRAFQGEATSVEQLMRSTAQLTNALADKDAVIGRVVTNLGAVLEGVGERDQELSSMIVAFRSLMEGLATDSDAISSSLPSLAGLLGDTAALVGSVREPLTQGMGALRGVAGQLNKDRSVLENSLNRVPDTLRTMIRTASYGSWFTFYICGLDIQVRLLGGVVNLGGVGVAANERDTVCGSGPIP